jgi:hypothetical protein
MTKRLQVILQDEEYKAVQRAARSRRMSLAEWVRQALDIQRRREPADDITKKLEVLRTAVNYNFPTADIEQMLAEIESGYLSGKEE